MQFSYFQMDNYMSAPSSHTFFGNPKSRFDIPMTIDYPLISGTPVRSNHETACTTCAEMRRRIRLSKTGLSMPSQTPRSLLTPRRPSCGDGGNACAWPTSSYPSWQSDGVCAWVPPSWRTCGGSDGGAWGRPSWRDASWVPC